MRHLLCILFLALTPALWGCRSTAAGPEQPPVPPAPYTRIANPDTNTVQLQIAIRKFVPARNRGPAIWLVGTMHVGEPAYYKEVQKFLDTQTVVLYEGVNTESHSHHVGKEPAPATNSPAVGNAKKAGGGFSMQSALADSLGLVFQLDAIDYERTNFLNSDLSILQIQRLMVNDPQAKPAAPGQPTKSNASFDALLEIMDGTSFLGSLFKMGMQIVGANPKLQALAKLTLIEAVGRLKGDFSALRGLPPEMKQMITVLIEARNENVVADIKTELKKIPRQGSFAIFYGTGHMNDMEKKITKELNYRPAEEKWLTVFSVDVQKMGVSQAELQSLRNMVKWELDQMQPQ